MRVGEPALNEEVAEFVVRPLGNGIGEIGTDGISDGRRGGDRAAWVDPTVASVPPPEPATVPYTAAPPEACQ